MRAQGVVGFIIGTFLFIHPLAAVFLGISGINVPALSVSIIVATLGSLLYVILYKHTILKPSRWLGAVGLVAFFAIVLYSENWSIAPYTAGEKANFFAFVIVIPCILIVLAAGLLPSASSQSPNQQRAFLSFRWVAIGLCTYVLCFVLFAFPTIDGSARLSLPGIENPIWTARFAGAFLVVLLYRYHLAQGEKKLSIIVFLALITFYILIESNSRAVMLSLLVSSLYIFQRSMSQLFLRAGVLVVVGLILLSIVEIDTLSRGYYSILERQRYLDFVLNSPEAGLGGFGIGSFGMALSGIDFQLYPHNILIEIWFETGIISLLLFLSCIAIILFIRGRSELKALFIYFLVAAMFSGDLVGNAQTFYLAAALLVNRSLI